MEKLKAKLAGAWRSRTVYFGLLLMLAGYVQEQRGALDPLIPVEWRPVAWVAIGCAVIWLRWMTTKPLEEK
jgi:hypothetical protein